MNLETLYVRVKRDDEFLSISVADMTEDEVYTFVETFDEDRAKHWLISFLLDTVNSKQTQ